MSAGGAVAPAARDPGHVALLISFALLAAALVGAVFLVRGQQESQRWVAHTLEVEEQLSSVLSRVQQAETGQRGFLITRNEAYLEPFTTGARDLRTEMAELKLLVADSPIEAERAAKLEKLAIERLARLSQFVEMIRKGDSAGVTAGVKTGVGLNQMQQIRALIAEMRAHEADLLKKRNHIATLQSNLLLLWLAITAIGVAVVAFFVTRSATRRTHVAILAQDAAEAAHARLIAETEQREIAEAQLRQLSKMESIGQLTGGIAHDFNNMLAIVIGSLDMAKRRVGKDPAKAAHSIDNALQGAERAAQLTSRLLAFARRQPLAPGALDANKLVAGMSELLRRTIGETIRFETVLAGGLWPAFIDAGQLENALVNLCVNARDAMPEGGRLTIETANTHLDDAYAASHTEVVPGQYVMVSVTDTGTGMPEDVIERAFDPFFSTKEVGKGTGLGLSQVYGFVKQSGGHVKIYSELGVGTIVKLYIPRHFGEEDRRPVPAPEAELPQGRGEVILVVEDEEQVRIMSVDALRELGYVVIHASGPTQALAMLDTHASIDLLFTDIVMPDMTGRTLAERVQERMPHVPVLYTTGYTRNAIVHNGMLDHDVDFLAKPFSIAQLAAKVRQVLDERG
ncbi:CHASE3 domain-containing protein [Sphingomonas sp. HITSZ_GF]|uniref:CHASE3 domain-containing protein n=1 Tax=Sphingomonas sp. HITSZ_GF TaxID=3037247 RepID=UPI00240DED5A|nr:CHASE3 domain-containing protein [Sphingomonas sp. HITSZ_GF]MDG2535414.1 CHASE3 domain-containing protein [Sphingomonas sp. HITSZ_GF]